MRNPSFKQAVVVGAGMAGLAAAKAIAPHFEKVTVFDRDSLPDAPAPRSGTPQSRHTHALLAGGHSALDRMFPGIEIDLMDAGAVRMRLRATSAWSCPVSTPFRDGTSDTTNSLCRARLSSASAATGSNRSRTSKSFPAPASLK
jgi:2-polyprenyl-6-methoxyphenol hydroxylase-like FAD-dependent oxidoreductase